MAIRKRFDKELHAKTDELAKAAARNVFKGTNFTLHDNANIHGVDLFALDKEGNHLFNVECEIKTNWKAGEMFKYPDVNFLHRKEKYCKLEKPTLFLMFNQDLKQYLVVKGQDVLSSPLEEVKNKYVWAGELFFKVPLKNVVFNDIETALQLSKFNKKKGK